MPDAIKQNIKLAYEQLRPAALLGLFYKSKHNLSCAFKSFAVTSNLHLPVVGLPNLSFTTPIPLPAAGFNLALVSASLIGVLFFSTHLRMHYNLQPVAHAAAIKNPSLPPKAVPKTMSAAQPLQIDIPSVDISAPIVPTDLNSLGGIAVPDSPAEAGWYDRSPTPGQLGPAIIVGHVDYLTGIAVFWQLRNVQPGAEVNVSRADGRVAKFKVTSIQQYSRDNFPDSLIYGNIDYAGIRLITCGGVFDPATRHYSDNTVVFGTLE